MLMGRAAAAFVDAQRIARLATVDDRGRPHVVPICFARTGDVVYSVIDEKPKRGDYMRLRRLRNIASNPNVQVLLDVYDDADWSRLRYLQLRGRARLIDHGAEHGRALILLRDRYAQYGAMSLEGRPIIAIDVERVIGWSAD